MFRSGEERRRRLYEVVERFRQKGAVSLDKAMTAEELGLPPRFKEAMRRRLGQLGIFVEVDGKYYLSEDRLKQFEERINRSQRDEGGWGSRRNMLTLRITRMALGLLFIIILLINIFAFSWELRLIAAFVGIAWIALTVTQIYYLSRARRRFSHLNTSKFFREESTHEPLETSPSVPAHPSQKT